MWTTRSCTSRTPARRASSTPKWSGKHGGIGEGIGLVTLLGTDDNRHLPCDYRLHDKGTNRKTKNDHFGGLLAAAAARGFAPGCVLFDP